jgi:hypothetical protein
MLKKGGAREEVCSIAGEEGPELVAAPKKSGLGLPKPVRRQQQNSPDQQPQSKREQQCADRRPRGGGLGSGPGGVRSAMPPPPTPPECERAVPRQRRLCAHQVPPTNGETVFPPRRPFPGCDYRLSGLARAGLWFRASRGRTRDASKKKKGGTRPPPVVPGSRLRQVSFCRLSRHEPRVDRNAIVDRVEKILPVQPHIANAPETFVRLD